MDTQLVLPLSFYYFLSSTSSLQTEKMKTEKNVVLLSAPFCAPSFHGFYDLSALQTSTLHSRGSHLLLVFFLWLCILPLGFLQGVLLDWVISLNLITTEKFKWRNFIYMCYGLNILSPQKCTYWDPNPNVLVWEVGTWKASVTSVKLSQRGLVSLLWEERPWEHFCHLLP